MRSLLIFLLLATFGASGQKTTDVFKITYSKISNGQPVPSAPIVIYASRNYTFAANETSPGDTKPATIEKMLIERPSLRLIQIASLREGTIFSTDTVAIASQKMEFLPGEKTILGYKCRLAKTVVNSNTIEFWFTEKMGVKAAPTVLGQNLGVVLEMTRNGNFTIKADKIEKVKSAPALPVLNRAQQVDMLTYRDLIWKNLFTTVRVFKNDTINFGNMPKARDSVFHFANGTVIGKRVKFPDIKPGSQIFIDLAQKSNGDAYDRTGTVFLIPTQTPVSFLDALHKEIGVLPVYQNQNGKKYQGVAATSQYWPAVELMRFFTPFGVGKYNTIKLKNKTWQDSAYYRQDVSEFGKVLSGKEVWIGTTIGNYDKGGHVVTLNFTIHPEPESPGKSFDILPVFNTTNIMEMEGQEYGTMFSDPEGLKVEFSLEEDMKDAKLRYTTTGHGGWENGDEFVMKKNTVILDGQTIFSFIPWRTDCGSYRNYNPASGNFGNGLSSSDYSRSNWCPGTVTNPVFIEIGNLKKGRHTIQVLIPQGKPEGTSFSSWNVSGTLIGKMK